MDLYGVPKDPKLRNASMKQVVEGAVSLDSERYSGSDGSDLGSGDGGETVRLQKKQKYSRSPLWLIRLRDREQTTHTARACDRRLWSQERNVVCVYISVCVREIQIDQLYHIPEHHDDHASILAGYRIRCFFKCHTE